MGLPYEWSGAEGPRRREARLGRGPSAAGRRGARPRAPRPEARGLTPAPPGCRALRQPAVLGRAPLRAARPGLGSRFRPRARAFAVGRGLLKHPGGPRRPVARGGRPRARQPLPPPRRSCSAPRPASVCRGGGGWAGARLLLREGAGAPGASTGRAPLPPAPHALARTRPENWSPEDSKPPSYPAAKFGALLDCMFELAKKRRGEGAEN